MKISPEKLDKHRSLIDKYENFAEDIFKDLPKCPETAKSLEYLQNSMFWAASTILDISEL